MDEGEDKLYMTCPGWEITARMVTFGCHILGLSCVDVYRVCVALQ